MNALIGMRAWRALSGRRAVSVLLFFTVFLAACGNSGSGTPVGAWEVDRKGMIEAWDSDGADSNSPAGPGMRTMALAMIDSSSGTVLLAEDGTADVDLGVLGESLAAGGTWSADGTRITIRLDGARGPGETLSGVLEGQRLRFESRHGEPALVLKRSSGSAKAAAGSRAATAASYREPPPLGPLRKSCPSEAAERSGRSPVDDIAGLRPGMRYDDVLAILECRRDLRLVQQAPLWTVKENFGIPTRQLLRASDGIPCDGEYSPKPVQGQSDCDTGGGHFEPLRNITQEFLVVLTGMPDQEVARAIWRRTYYTAEAAQPVALVIEALGEKYGLPQLQATGSHSRLNHTRPGATNIVWIHHPNGSPLPPPASEFSSAGLNWETCVNGPQPWFATQQRWSSGCGLTVRAEILPQDGNSLLAREMNVMVMNQRDLYHGSQQFEHALKLVSEERLRAQGSRPDL